MASGKQKSSVQSTGATASSSEIVKTLEHFDTPAPADFTKEDDLAAYREMLLMRRFEEKAGQLYGMGCLLYTSPSPRD